MSTGIRNHGWWMSGRMVHIYAMYLLALFRETRAYPLLVRIFSRPGRVFVRPGRRRCDSGSGPDSGVGLGRRRQWHDRAHRERASERIRPVNWPWSGMVSLVTTGQRPRDEVIAYFLQLFQKLERKPGAQWDGLAHVCADLWPQETIDELGRAYEDGLVDTGASIGRTLRRLGAGPTSRHAWARYRDATYHRYSQGHGLDAVLSEMRTASYEPQVDLEKT